MQFEFRMKNKSAILFCLLGVISLIYLWYVLLLVPYPETNDIYSYLKNTIFYMFALEESPVVFYISSLVSILVCALTGLWLWLDRSLKIAVGIVSIHTLCVLFLYSWEYVLVIALPLTLLLRRKNA